MPAKIAVIYHSLYKHVETLGESVTEGAKSTGAEVDVLQFREVLPKEALEALHAAPKNENHEVLTDAKKLQDYDGFLLGFGTRYGRAPAAVSTFFDETGGLWLSGGLVGKFAGIFTSSASQHGGQETTALTTIPFLTHHGINYVPLGYVSPKILGLDSVEGGSPWSASTIANGDGSRQVSDIEKEVARDQGKTFAALVNQFVEGKKRLEAETSQPASSSTSAKEENGKDNGTPKAKKRSSFLQKAKGTIKKFGHGHRSPSDDGKKDKEEKK